ncbi:MAG: hypothetical protein CMJ72_09830 [Planctomycetaceae bacterium]|nr:hypothetical protein [Planctomycetaceae bacterium]
MDSEEKYQMNSFQFGLFQKRCLVAVFIAACLAPQLAIAQVVQQAIGGIAVDAQGVLSTPTELDQEKLGQIRQQAHIHMLDDIERWTDLRAVSLKQIEAQLAESRRLEKPVPPEVLYLAGLQRVQYVLVYPQQGDVVLAGPAEGWRMDAMGNMVGLTSGRPVLLLDDLVVALRTRDVSQLEPISCSIDPTPEGIQRLRTLTSRQNRIGNIEHTLASMENALGKQVVSVTGVPPTSHFARTMVAADFRMKRLAMGMEPAPIDGMPSFLEILREGRGNPNMSPRWWLAPNYLPLAKDVAGQTWELRGQGVRCMTEQDYLDDSGRRKTSAKSGIAAQRWADTFTKRFNDLAEQDSSFGKLRNAMDLAIAAALIDQERMLDQTGLELPELIREYPIVRYHAPTQVSSQATFVQRRGDYLVSTSGGVQLLPWKVVEQSHHSAELNQIHKQLSTTSTKWYRE